MAGDAVAAPVVPGRGAMDDRRILEEVVRRVTARWSRDDESLEQALFDTVYEERRRIAEVRDRDARRRQDAFWRKVHARAAAGDARAQRVLLKEVVEAFAGEVAGHFDPRTYAVATRVLPPALDGLLNALSPLRLLRSLPGGGGRLDEQVVLEGEIGPMLRLSRLGTLVLVPTHVSNLDSILMGYAIHRLGLPPFVYGAGLNLFANPLIGFFMNHLGAYRVDRLKKAELYKDVLKTYAGCTMEEGFHNLFFPGGTRSRSGAIESRLKMGLLGMGLDAYVHGLAAGRPRPDVFVVPCTLNYGLVLEAETLIDDHLKEAGRSRYIIEDDEFSRPRDVLRFLSQIFRMESRVNVRFGQPLDVFGHPVDDQGISRDGRGRRMDRTRRVQVDGRPAHEPERDEAHTRALAEAIVATWRRDTVLKSTHLACRATFDLLRDRSPGTDLYRLLRGRKGEASLPLSDWYVHLDRVLAKVRAAAAAGKVRLDGVAAGGDAMEVAGEAMVHLSSFHRRPALERRGDRLVPVDRTLLLYYGNRVDPEVLP